MDRDVVSHKDGVAHNSYADVRHMMCRADWALGAVLKGQDITHAKEAGMLVRTDVWLEVVETDIENPAKPETDKED